MNGSGARYDDILPGATFSSTMTVTETHLVLGAGLIGDFNPHHVDETYAKGSRYGGRILHGMLTGAIMGAPLGMYFHGTAIGFLEHNVRFVAPVRAGDTLTTTWHGRCEARQAEARRRHRRSPRRVHEPGRCGCRDRRLEDARRQCARAPGPLCRRASTAPGSLQSLVIPGGAGDGGRFA